MIVDRALIPDSMVIPGSSGSLTVDGRPHSYQCAVGQYLPGQIQTGRMKTREELKIGPVQATTMSMTTKLVICLVGCPTKQLANLAQED